MTEDRLGDCEVEHIVITEIRRRVRIQELRLLDADLVLSHLARDSLLHKPFIRLNADVIPLVQIGDQQTANAQRATADIE